ncbi:MAG: HAD family phosphatase [Actinomycetota bacterium]
MVIEAVLFDYSGVMTANFDVPSDKVPFDVDALFLQMVGAMTDDSVPHPWHDLERGDITLDSYIEFIEQAVPGAGAAFAVDSPHNVMANLPLRQDRVELVRSLRADGLRVGLVTNNVAEWAPVWRSELLDDLFDVVIDSSGVGCRKPEPEIYRLALDALGGIDASDALFVDDFEWNVTGAVQAGLVGLHCTGDIDLDSAVRNRLG